MSFVELKTTFIYQHPPVHGVVFEPFSGLRKVALLNVNLFLAPRKEGPGRLFMI